MYYTCTTVKNAYNEVPGGGGFCFVINVVRIPVSFTIYNNTIGNENHFAISGNEL